MSACRQAASQHLHGAEEVAPRASAGVPVLGEQEHCQLPTGLAQLLPLTARLACHIRQQPVA